MTKSLRKTLNSNVFLFGMKMISQPLLNLNRLGGFLPFPCDNQHSRVPASTKLGDDPTQPDRRPVQQYYPI